MASINFDEIEYAELITFQTVAETLNMSVAAEKLCVTQPAVSKRIANLESRFGIILFVRVGRGLQLTPAGRAFHQELLKSMEHLHRAFITAAEVQAEPVRTLRIGYDGFFDIPLLYEISRRYQVRSPGTRVQLYSYTEENCLDLFNGAADIMIGPETYRGTAPSRVEYEPVGEFQFCALMSREHPLADRRTLSVTDLMGVSLTVARIEDSSPYLATVRKIFAKYGISPRFDHAVQRENLLFALMTEGVGIASTGFWRRLNARTAAFYEENLRFFPLEGETLSMGFLWRADVDQTEIRHFLKIYHEVLAEPGNREILDSCYS